MAEVKVTLKKSLIGRKQDQIKTCQALGLTRPGRTVVKPVMQRLMECLTKFYI